MKGRPFLYIQCRGEAVGYDLANSERPYPSNRLALICLSTHLRKLEDEGYVALEKGYKGRKPNTMVKLTAVGRAAFKSYKTQVQQVLNDLPED